jgi:hypothetical protein
MTMAETTPTNGVAALVELNQQYADTLELLEERITELEGSLAGEDAGWMRLGGDSGREFSRGAIRHIAKLSRLFFLANPLIKRPVTLQGQYVFGQGVSISGQHPDVDEVVQQFLDDEKNRAELTSHQARIMKEVALQTEGNIFFVLFTNKGTGRVRVRTLPADEVEDITTDPDDAKSPWFYKRVWCQKSTNLETGRDEVKDQTAYYPDWRYNPTDKRPRIGDHPVYWDQPVYHIKVGGLPDMRFGVPETYAAHDWARAYKTFLEDVATLMRAYSRFAGKITNLSGKRAVQASKTRLGTTAGTGVGGETNPPPATGSIFMGANGVDYTPLNIRGATVNPEDGRRLLLMVCAAVGLPECYSADTEVLTEQGFMRHAEWKPGLRIACFDPAAGLVSWQHPAALTVHYYNGDMIRFRNQQTDILVTPNHRMWTAPEVQWKLSAASGRVATAAYGPGGRQRVADGAPPAVDRSWRIETADHLLEHPRDAGWKVATAVRFNEPASYSLIDTPIGRVDAIAWATFIGHWISEGSAAASVCKSGDFRKDGTPIMRTFRRVLLAQKPGPVLEKMKAALRTIGLHFGEHGANGGVRNLVVWNKGLWGWLKSECGEGSHSKRIPQALLDAPRDVRRALFDALMEGDGGKSGFSLRYSSTSQRLADDMQRLAISLGYGASVTLERRQFNGRDCPIYRIWIRTRITDVAHLKPKHIQREAYSGGVYCFSVPSGIYVTRRNGKVAIQGNTFLGDVSVGTLATAKSLDRPTELKYKDRQTLWIDIFQHLLTYQVKQAVQAKKLKGAIVVTEDGDEVIELGNELDPDTGQELIDPATGQPIPINPGINVDFPAILEHDVGESVQAIVTAATLGGKPLAGVLDIKLVARLLLSALGQDDIDDLLDELFPDDESEDQQEQDVEHVANPQDNTANPAAPGQQPPANQPATEATRPRKRSPKVKPRGKPLAPARATITTADLRGAAKAWDDAVPDAAGLLDAKVLEQ